VISPASIANKRTQAFEIFNRIRGHANYLLCLEEELRLMPHWKNLSLLTFIALILAVVLAMLLTRPSEARVDLHGGKGEAVWFFRSCSPGRGGEAASWAVDLNPSVSDRSSLKFQVNNAYPGYRLYCDLYFANSGKSPISVKHISVYNPDSGDLSLSAKVAPGEDRKVLRPCGSKPLWGKNPTSLPTQCRSKIQLALTVGPDVKENSRLDFAVQVRLEEKPGDHSY
jgi:hypothetical protein